MYDSIGFIGAGNMAGAMIGGIVTSGIIKPENIFISDINSDSADRLVREYQVKALPGNIDVAKTSKALVLAVKPQVYKEVIQEIKESIAPDTLIVSIAAGITIEEIKKFFGSDVKVIRTVPNTPALVGEGMTAMAFEPPVEKSDVDFARKVFFSFGIVEEVKEELLNAVTAVSGSSPAFAFMFIEAMADAAVLLGLPRDKSYVFASQVLRGAAKLVMETGKHPGALKDMVCSPAGTTIEGVRVLEEKGLRSAVIEAMISTAQRAQELSKSK